MTRETSIEAYRRIEAEGLLSKRRAEVYRALFVHGPCTANELYKHMRSPDILNTNIVTRLGELRGMGVAKELGARECRVTHQTVLVWDVTAAMPRPLMRLTEPTRSELIEALCKLLEEVKDGGGTPTWLEDVRKILKLCAKHRRKLQ